MFILQNKFGNAQVVAKTERRRDELVAKGFKVINDDKKSVDNMKVDELKLYAAEHNIDISAAKNKAEMLEIIKAAN